MSIVNTDGFSMLATANVSLVGFTFEGGIYSSTWNKVADFLITPIDLPSGKVNFSLTPAQTISLGVGTYNFSIKWTDTSNQKRTIMSGNFIIVNG